MGRMSAEPSLLFVCPNCFSVDARPGTCPDCQRERVACDPGDPDNPCRQPPMDAQGNLQSRAPLWWLARSIPYLREKIKKMKAVR